MLERLQARHAGPVAPVHERPWSPREISAGLYGGVPVKAYPGRPGFAGADPVRSPDGTTAAFGRELGREGAGTAPA